MRSEDLSRVIDAFGPSDVQKQRMLDTITGRSATDVSPHVRHSHISLPHAHRKGRMSKVLILAMAICLFSGTAFALSNAEWFKGIFGNNIYLVEDQILSPMESVADDQFKLTLEGILSDAYSSTAIVSVEALNELSRLELEQISSYFAVSPLQQNIRSNSSTVVELEHLSDRNTKRFMVGFWSNDGPLSGDLEVSLTTETSRLTLSAPTVSTIRSVTIQPDEGHYASADYVPQSVLISPIHVVVIGHERKSDIKSPIRA